MAVYAWSMVGLPYSIHYYYLDKNDWQILLLQETEGNGAWSYSMYFILLVQVTKDILDYFLP